MLRPKPPQNSFYGSYLYDKIVPADHLLRKINQVVDFSFVHELVKDRYTSDFGRPAEDPEFMLRLCLLQYIYGDSDRHVVENARMHNGYKYFLGLSVDEEVPDDTTISYFRTVRLGEEKFRQVFQQIVQQCIDKGLVKGKRQIIDSTHIEADVARNSLAGILRICRRNVVQDITRQDSKVADRLGISEPSIRKQDRFSRMEESLEDEVTEASNLLDAVTAVATMYFSSCLLARIGNFIVAIHLPDAGAKVPHKGPTPSMIGLSGERGSVPGFKRSYPNLLFIPQPPKNSLATFSSRRCVSIPPLVRST
jgi:transposase